MATTIHVEQALLGQVKQRDREAFLELHDRTIMDVSRLVAFLLDDPSGIEDVIQAVANCYGKRDLTWQNVVQGSTRGKVRITKRGNSLLRKHLYLTVTHLLSYQYVFQELHAENIQVKRMTKMQSIMKLIGKLARMLVAMARDVQPFIQEKVQKRAA